jgi:uncharacterized membrane protein
MNIYQVIVLIIFLVGIFGICVSVIWADYKEDEKEKTKKNKAKKL